MLGLVALATGVAQGDPGTARVEVRVWQAVEDELDIAISARPSDGSWRTLGTIPLALDDGFSSTGRYRYGDIHLNVPLSSRAAPVTIEVRVWQHLQDGSRIYVSARGSHGSWRTLGTIRLLLDDGLSSTGRYRYGDISLEVPLPEVAVTTPTPPAPAELLTSFSDGRFRVGIDIAPGPYRAVAPSDDCEWSREVGSQSSRGVGRIPVEGPLTIVEIAASDTMFASSGCGGWSPVPTATVTPVETFGDGTFLVGADVAPGRYRATGSTDACYWLRLDSFGAVFSSERPDDWATTRLMLLDEFGFTVVGDRYPIVDIAASDGGFFSDGCGTWSSDWTRVHTPGEDFGNGLFLVGAEIAPGRYRAIEPSNNCHWVRLNHFSGELSAWYGWDNFAISRGRRSDYRPVVDIEATDAAFYSSGCGIWSSDSTPIATPGEPFGSGTFIVGIDIAPGRYRTTTATENCLWFRLYDFGGVLGAYEGLNATARDRLGIVDIAPTDAGFTSRGCGTWSPDLTPVVTPGQPFGDGTYLVGAEIAPGRYHASDPTGSCYWTRLGSFDGDRYFGYANSDDILGYGSLAIVDILETDAGFRSSGCGTWSEANPQVAEPQRSFGDGTYIVGTDIAPGRYFAHAPSDRCQWDRLDAFGGYDRGDDIGIGWGRAWDLPSRLAVVDIKASDTGFRSWGCGEWTQTFEPRVTSGEPPGDGFYLVGIEVAPGRYRATTPASCMFERRSGFSGVHSTARRYSDEGWLAGTNDSTIPHGSLGIVDIEPTDVGFISEGCGWTADLTPRLVPGSTFSNGTYLVGSEIAPGRYRTSGKTGGCWWKRMSKFGGHFGPDSGAIVSTVGQGWTTLVDIAPTDAGFHSWGCGTWIPELSPVLAPGEPISNGTFLVGVDLAPGRYRALPRGDVSWCYWARLSGFGGTGDEVIGRLYGYFHNRQGASLIVEIKPSDAGFYTADACGEWRPDAGRPVSWPNDQLRDGVYYVGTEVAPGLYRAASPSPQDWTRCSWWRLSGFGGSKEEFLGRFEATWDTDSAIVEIAATDAGFASSGCGRWTTDLAPLIAPGDPFADGAWLVGEEISPGRYRNTPGYTDSEGRGWEFECEWRRVSGFGGSEAETIEAGSAEPGAATTVDVAVTDGGFISRGCGTWTLIPP